MNVLFLEDRGATAYYVERWLEANEYITLSAYNINDAQDHWSQRKQVPVHCILLDSNVPMDGLTSKQKEEAKGGTLAGWVWLRDNVLPESPEMRQRIIIYSDYVNVLQQEIPKEEYRGIKVISKDQCRSSADQIFESIQEISRIIHA